MDRRLLKSVAYIVLPGNEPQALRRSIIIIAQEARIHIWRNVVATRVPLFYDAETVIAATLTAHC